MKKILFNGVCTAAITPFTKDGIDYKSLKKQIEYQINNGIKTICFLGTTGEAPTILVDEYENIIKFVYDCIMGRAKLIIGSGSNSTKTAIENSIKANKYGADGLLVVSPYYNKCTKKGLINYYKDISKNVDIPIIAYNVPSRTSVDITPDLILQLTDIRNIYGIKECSKTLLKDKKIFNKIKNKIAIYSGDDFLNYKFLKQGADGIISVASNIFPKILVNQYNLSFEKNKRAKYIQKELLPFIKALFNEVNPIPVKYAMKIIKLDSGRVRKPLTQPTKENKEILKKEILKLYLENYD